MKRENVDIKGQSNGVKVVYPLKQGLKLQKKNKLGGNKNGKSSISIKTRIETIVVPPLVRTMMEGKSSISIKTRIETIHASIELVKTRKVKVVYPLKQGLKHYIYRIYNRVINM